MLRAVVENQRGDAARVARDRRARGRGERRRRRRRSLRRAAARRLRRVDAPERDVVHVHVARELRLARERDRGVSRGVGVLGRGGLDVGFGGAAGVVAAAVPGERFERELHAIGADEHSRASDVREAPAEHPRLVPAAVAPGEHRGGGARGGHLARDELGHRGLPAPAPSDVPDAHHRRGHRRRREEAHLVRPPSRRAHAAVRDAQEGQRRGEHASVGGGRRGRGDRPDGIAQSAHTRAGRARARECEGREGARARFARA